MQVLTNLYHKGFKPFPEWEPARTVTNGKQDFYVGEAKISDIIKWLISNGAAVSFSEPYKVRVHLTYGGDSYAAEAKTLKKALHKALRQLDAAI